MSKETINEIILLKDDVLRERLAEMGENKPANTGRVKLLEAYAQLNNVDPAEVLKADEEKEVDSSIQSTLEQKENPNDDNPIIGYVVMIASTEKNKHDVFLANRGRTVQIKRDKAVPVKPWVMTSLKEAKKTKFERDERTGAVLDKKTQVPTYAHNRLAVIRQSQAEFMSLKEFKESDLDRLAAAQ